MDIASWEARYQSRTREQEDFNVDPVPLLVETVAHLQPGKALDLACGAGRNALWLAQNGWKVTAIDGATAAVDTVRTRAFEKGLSLDALVADLEAGQYVIESEFWNLIVISYYLQRDLLEPAKQGLKPGGIVIVIVHLTEPGEEPTARRLRPGELTGYFARWEILHSYEGKPRDAHHQRPVAEIVACRPKE